METFIRLRAIPNKTDLTAPVYDIRRDAIIVIESSEFHDAHSACVLVLVDGRKLTVRASAAEVLKVLGK